MCSSAIILILAPQSGVIQIDTYLKFLSFHIFSSHVPNREKMESPDYLDVMANLGRRYVQPYTPEATMFFFLMICNFLFLYACTLKS